MQYQKFNNGIIYQGDCVEVLPSLEVGSFDHVLQDPPYGHLKHRIETFFDYKQVFKLLRDKINNKGNILTFGRGDLFFEWNLYLRDIGFIHKEDCTLSKNNAPNIFNKILRYGEYFTIRGLKESILNKVYIPLTDECNVSDQSIADWHRRAFSMGNEKYKKMLIDYLESGIIKYDCISKSREYVAVDQFLTKDRCVVAVQSLVKGKILGNVLNSSRELLPNGWSHPTIKPSKEMGYLIECISNEGETIIDPFLGSGTTAVACIKTGRKFIGIELDQKYFDMCCERIRDLEDNNLFY